MVFLNYSTMEMVAKIVYYGPGLCGKTTNLQTIYKKTSSQSRGEMVSLATETDRTLFFDLLPMEVGVIGGFKTKLQLYTVPGQVFYNTTRKLVLRGVDGIVFVADSQIPMMDANVESFQNLKDNLAELNLSLEDIPLVLQYNKRDLPSTLTLEELNSRLNPDGSIAYQEASALNGSGVFETLREVTRLTLMVLNQRRQNENAPEKPAPEPVAAAPAAAVDSAMPTNVSFDEDDSEPDISATFDDDSTLSPPGAKDSFEQTLDNMDLDLADDDEAFLDEDSLDMEEFDEWEEDDSLEASLGEPINPMDDFNDNDDSEPIATLNLDDEADPVVSSLDELEMVDDDIIEDEDITLDGDVDLDDAAMALDLPTSEIPIPDAIADETMIEDFESKARVVPPDEEAPPADFGSMDLDASIPDVDLGSYSGDHSLPDLSDPDLDDDLNLDDDPSDLAAVSEDNNFDGSLDASLDDGLDFNLDETPASLDLDELENQTANARETDDLENTDTALDFELDAALGTRAADEAAEPTDEPALADASMPYEESSDLDLDDSLSDLPDLDMPPAEEDLTAPPEAEPQVDKDADTVKGSDAVAKAAEKLKRPKRKTSNGLDELKRLTTRIQTSSLSKKKDKDLGSLLDGLGKTAKKKSTVEKHQIEIPGDIDAAQLNLVLLDADENVVHTQLLKATPRKLEDGKYQIKLVLDLQKPDA